MLLFWIFIQNFINHIHDRGTLFYPWLVYVTKALKRYKGPISHYRLNKFDTFIFSFFYNERAFYSFFPRFENPHSLLFFNRLNNYPILINIFSYNYKNNKNTYLINLKSFYYGRYVLKRFFKKYVFNFFRADFVNSSKSLSFIINYRIFSLNYTRIYYYIHNSAKYEPNYIDDEVDVTYVPFFNFLVFNLEEDDIEFYNLKKFSDFYTNGDLIKLWQVITLVKENKFNYPLGYYYYFWFEHAGLFKEEIFKIQCKYNNLYKPYNIFRYWDKKFLENLKYRNSFYIYAILEPFWKSKLLKRFTIRFRDTSTNKYIDLSNLLNYKLQFLRKNKIFNKSRYSRNRQLYRTGVYWCLWLNIILVYVLYFYFYRFSFTFGYLWVVMSLFVISFIFGRVLQNRLYTVENLKNEFKYNIGWFMALFINLLNIFKEFWKVLKKSYLVWFYLLLKKNLVFDFDLWARAYRTVYWFSLNFGPSKHRRFAYIWEYFQGEDTSFLKWKSKAHWFKQVWKMLTTYN